LLSVPTLSLRRLPLSFFVLPLLLLLSAPLFPPSVSFLATWLFALFVPPRSRVVYFLVRFRVVLSLLLSPNLFLLLLSSCCFLVSPFDAVSVRAFLSTLLCLSRACLPVVLTRPSFAYFFLFPSLVGLSDWTSASLRVAAFLGFATLSPPVCFLSAPLLPLPLSLLLSALFSSAPLLSHTPKIEKRRNLYCVPPSHLSPPDLPIPSPV